VVVLLDQRELLALLVAQRVLVETLSSGKTIRMSPQTIQFPQTKMQCQQGQSQLTLGL
jgi:hypothetical protein